MRIVSVVGARPQFVKLAPVAHACRAAGVEHRIIHTGQHYDPMLSDVFFRDLNIPDPDVHLGVGSASHGRQTGAMMAALDEHLPQLDPGCVLVYGDTNSTLAAALSAVKMHVPVAHLEAGLRSFNRSMPEEHNRVLTDHAADLLLAPTAVAARHLAAEGLAERTLVVGDVMTDVLYQVRDRVAEKPLPFADATAGAYVVATIHRAENTDNPDHLASIVRSLATLPVPVYFVAHPRTLARGKDFGIDFNVGAIRLCTPLAYPDLVRAVMGSGGVVTDSGGLQKEAFLLHVPCTTIRPETEWVETVELGWNVLVEPGDDLTQIVMRSAPTGMRAQAESPYGDGHAAQRVASEIVAAFGR